MIQFLHIHRAHYQFIEGRGTEVPTIDPGEMMFCKDTHQEGFDSTKVNAIELNKDDEKESDKDSEVNSMEKMPKKKTENLFPMRVITKHLILIWLIRHPTVERVA